MSLYAKSGDKWCCGVTATLVAKDGGLVRSTAANMLP